MLGPGDTVRGYTVTALLGEGGMGAVYAAVRESDGLEVALKILHLARGEHAERARTEAAAQQLLDSPHVVRVLDVIDVQGAPGLALERVDGPTLRQWLDAGRPSLDDALAVFRGVLAGVEHAHERGLIHRDLKPSNVLLAVEPEGIVAKVADFGLAKLDGSGATRTGVMLGTPGYMAPEQIRDAKRADRRADVFALGVMLYELVCGQAPISGHDVIAAFQEITSRSWVDPASLGAPPAIAEAIRSALSPEPDERPADATALRVALDPSATFLGGAPELWILDPESEGAHRARSLSTAGIAASVDPSRPALRTPIAAPEGGLVGREDRLSELEDLARAPGLLTLRGPPGVGKTALAQTFARSQGTRRTWVGGVWWVGLRDAGAPEAATAAVLGVPEGNSVGHALFRRGKALLVLDEAELAAAAVAEAVAEWLADAPKLTVLVTSRIALGLEGERVVLVEPLGRADGIALFVRRARMDRAEWMPSPEERRAIGEVVARLDGLPLAIELAAARSRLLAPADLLPRLERQLDLLRRRGADPRAASLRGAIASSWELLDPLERRAVGWLATAVGDVSASAAERLLEPLDPADPLGLMEGLEDASWLEVRQGADGRRYRMLESLRAFARESLDADELARAREAHARVYLAEAEQALGRFEATGEARAAAQLGEEIGDLLAISERFPGTPTGVRACKGAARWLGARGDLLRAEEAARQAVAWSPDDPEARVLWVERLVDADRGKAHAEAERLVREVSEDRLWCRASIALARTRELTAVFLEDLQGTLDRARALGDSLLEARAWNGRSAAEFRKGLLVEAEASIEEALALFRQAGHRPEEASALSSLGVIRLRRGNWEGSEQALREAARLSGEVGDRKAQAAALGRMAMGFARSGQKDRARTALEGALALSRQLGDRVGEGYALANLGAMEPDPMRAAELHRSAAVLARRAGDWQLLSLAQRNIGSAEILRGQSARAIEPYRETADALRRAGQPEAVRIDAWRALALIGCGRVDEGRALLGSLEGTGEDARVVELARLALDALDGGAGVASLDGIDFDREPWDARLTANLVRAVTEEYALRGSTS